MGAAHDRGRKRETQSDMRSGVMVRGELGEERLCSCRTTRHCAVAPSTPLDGTPRVDTFLLNYLHERDAGPRYGAATTGLETMITRRVCELRFALRQR